MKTGLYIHIPICIARCRYCDFYKLTAGEWEDIELFIRCLEQELRRLPDDFAPATVFIGGGTPTALEPANLASLFNAIHRNINLSHVVEFSCEANPGTLTREKLAILAEGGVSRMSIGVQTFNDKALRLLGRIHDATHALEGVRLLREAGFDTINIDLIQSIPGMTQADILADVHQVTELQPAHISYYNLIYESGTPMTRDRDAGRIVPPKEDEEADNYYAVKAALEAAGYAHYEISNFCRPGRECLHNMLYWQGGSYFGCGPSAHSHRDGTRFGNVRDLQAYCDRLQAGLRPFDEPERLDPNAKARETLVMWLRLIEGVDPERFRQVAGIRLEALCGDAVESLIEEHLLEWKENRLALTANALFICNAVLSELV